MNCNVVALTAVVLSLGACKTNDFSGSGASAPAATPTPVPVIKTPIPTPVPVIPVITPSPSPCIGNGISQIKLLTASIQVKAANQFVDYDVQWTDCFGNPKAISNANLKFDMNAVTDAFMQPVPYRLSLSDNSTNAISDNFQGVQGSDLFGNVSSKFAYWQTRSLSYVPQATTIRLRIDLSNHQFAPITSQTLTITAPVSIPTFLKLGDAPPVQQNITVNP